MRRLLDTINQPSDLRQLTYDQLRRLASEVREELTAIVTTTGGHLASNLGVVELTIALHRIFDSPQDKLIWDVGHQSYVHKLFTGRREQFHTLRQYQGLSGFTERSESPHDHFGAGHASTSVSAAMGMATARDLKGEDYNVVAIIGDGALTGGMAFEALNQAGHIGKKLSVILNDNGMSISPTVGAIARQFNRLRFDHRFQRAKEGARHTASLIPLGERMWDLGRKVKEGFKRIVIPTLLWEELGFIYIGPIDGHNIKAVETALLQARDCDHKPVLVHVVTTKGKGYHPAEKDAIGFHGISPQGPDSEKSTTYSAVFSQTVDRLLNDDPRIVVITAAMEEGNHLREASKSFSHRVIDVGICEQHAVTYAAGLATQGFVPIVAVYSTFLQRAFDQLIHDVCLQDLPVVFALDRSGIVGDDGKTHQGLLDLSYLSLIPNMIVSAPRNENELQHLLLTATRAGHPMAIRYPRSLGTGEVLESELRELPIGKGETLRAGGDLSIVAIGSAVAPACAASEELMRKGVDTTVINARFAKPLDCDLIAETAERTERLIVVEENVRSGGFGSTVAQFLQEKDIKTAVQCINIPDIFVEHGPQSILRGKYNLDDAGIAKQALTFVSSPKSFYIPSSSSIKEGAQK